MDDADRNYVNRLEERINELESTVDSLTIKIKEIEYIVDVLRADHSM